MATGVNVILTTRGICGRCLKYFVETGDMAVGRVFKRDLKCVAKASRVTILSTWPIWKVKKLLKLQCWDKQKKWYRREFVMMN